MVYKAASVSGIGRGSSLDKAFFVWLPTVALNTIAFIWMRREERLTSKALAVARSSFGARALSMCASAEERKGIVMKRGALKFLVLAAAALSLWACIPAWFESEGIVLRLPGQRCPVGSTVAGAVCTEVLVPPSVTCGDRLPVDEAAFRADPRSERPRHWVATWRISSGALPANGPALVLDGRPDPERWSNVWRVTLRNSVTHGIVFRLNGSSSGAMPRFDPSEGWVRRIFAASPATFLHDGDIADIRSVLFFRPSTGQRVHRAAGLICDNGFTGLWTRTFGEEHCAQYVHPAAVEYEGLGYFYLNHEDPLGTSQGSWSPATSTSVESVYAQTVCLAP